MRIVLILRHPLNFTTIYYTLAKGPMLRVLWSLNLGFFTFSTTSEEGCRCGLDPCSSFEKLR